ncbi:TerB family tellurite resistance protein [Crocinitomicaceae bacterium]|nr:TerB family tellurite resistance protein [Crocinitomicaceae bacterium]
MEKKAFTKELLKIAYAATVCDGDIDESELEVIEALEKEDFYLKEEDLSDVLKNYEKDAADDFLEFANIAVKETYTLDLTPAEKMIVINLAIAIVRADGKMQEQEISFVKSLILNLQLPEELVTAANGNWWVIQSKSNLDTSEE